MNASYSMNAMCSYKRVEKVGGIESADPHKLIEMLLNGVLENAATAKGHMMRGEIPEKGQAISKIIAILDGLRGSLDKAIGGDMAQNLDDLYDYMQRRLLDANLHNSVDIMDEVTSLTLTLKGAWNSITPEIRHGSLVNA